MVSLSENSRHAGGFYFTDDQPLIQATSLTAAAAAPSAGRAMDGSLEQDDEVLLLAGQDPNYRSIPSLPLILLQILLFLGMTAVSSLLPFLFTTEVCHFDAFALVVLSHCGMWVLLLVVDRVLYRMHNTSRLNGYLEFYRRTRLLRPWPIFVASAGNTVLLVTMVLLERFCPSPQQQCSDSFKRDYYPLIITLAELVVVIPVLVLYLVRTVRFRRERAPPDVVQQDLVSSFQSGLQVQDVGFQSGEGWESRLIERQSDMIRYLQDHSRQLGQHLMGLTARLDQLHGRRQLSLQF